MKSTGQLITLAETIRAEGESFGFRRGETILGLDKGLPQHEWNTLLNAINLAKGYVAVIEKHFGSIDNAEIPEKYLDQLASDWGCIEGHLHVFNLGMEPFRSPTILVSKTYRVVDEASRAEADNAECGFMFEEESYTLEECIDLIRHWYLLQVVSLECLEPGLTRHRLRIDGGAALASIRLKPSKTS